VADYTPFAQFRDMLFDRSPAASMAALLGAQANAPTAPQGGGADALDYLKARYSNVEVSNSFVDAAGHHIDCIRVNQQPSLGGGGDVASPPAFEEMPGSPQVGGGRFAAVASQLAEDRKDRFGNQAYCPPGFVPVLRVTPERIAKAGGLARFFQKAPDGGRHPSFGSGSESQAMATAGGPQVPFQVVGGVIHAYAHAPQWVAGNNCTGARSWLNVWTPNPRPGVFSLSQQWIAGNDGRGVQTIEGGWHVYPDLYNDQQPVTRLFVYWTADGYQTTGNYNLNPRPGQTGFIQVDNTWILGGAFPASSPGGEQRGFLMQWQRDPANGNWWLFLQGSGDPVAVGYYSAAQYGNGPLSQAAQSVDFGGETCGTPGSRQTGPMGSGQLASAGWQAAAFHKQVAYLTSGGWVPATLSPDQQDAPAYTIDLHNNSNTAWSTYFYFGGPGGTFP
jgi:hypothetical protein